MYKVKTLTTAQMAVLDANKDFQEDYETIKILSDDFKTEDETALRFDKLLYDAIEKVLNSKKDKPKETPKPKAKNEKVKKAKFDIGDEVYILTSDKKHYETTDTFFVKSKYYTDKGWIYELKSNENKDNVSQEQFLTKTPPSSKKPKAEPKTAPLPKSKISDADKAMELIKIIQQIQGNSIDAEQVENIVKNILKDRTICEDDLCDALTEKLNTVKQIKFNVKNFNTKPFKSDTPNLAKIKADIILGNNVMLIGGAGTGKTFLAEKVADVMGLQTEVINCNQFTSPIEINGGQTIEGYQEGKLIKAWSEGKILILDELPKLDPNTAGILNEALAKTAEQENSDRAYIVNTRGDRFKKKEGFGVIATGNVYPNTESAAYGANNKQDLSLLDRFAGSVYEIEKNPEFEKKTILPNHLFIWHIADTIRTLIEKNKWEAQVSIRFMQASLRVYLNEMQLIKDNPKIKPDELKTYKDVVDSFIWTFTEVQQVEIKRAIKYDKLFEKYQYRDMDIDKNPL
jgi:MoxR-like ATPase